MSNTQPPTSTDSLVQTRYAVVLDTGEIAATDSGPAIRDTKEEAHDLKHWIAEEFMNWDDDDSLSVMRLELHETN